MPYIMLKLCPLFLEGANLYIQIIALLCCVQHHNFITNLKPGLGTYWEIYTSRLHGLYLSHHVRTLSPGPALSMHGTSYFTVWDWDTGTRHSLRTTSLPRRFDIMLKKYLLFSIMLNAFLYPLFSKLCRHNPPNPTAGAEPISQGHCRKWHYKLNVVWHQHASIAYNRLANNRFTITVIANVFSSILDVATICSRFSHSEWAPLIQAILLRNSTGQPHLRNLFRSFTLVVVIGNAYWTNLLRVRLMSWNFSTTWCFHPHCILSKRFYYYCY